MPGEGNHSPLGGSIHGAAAAQLSGNGGHGNDVAPLLPGHDLAGLPGDGHGALDVDLADKVIVGIGEFLNGLQPVLQHARAVDQHIDLPEGVHRRLHQLLVVLGIGNVAPDEKGLGAGILDFLEYFVLIGFAHVCQHQLGALFGKDLGGLHADTGVTAGDDAYFVFQSAHDEASHVRDILAILSYLGHCVNYFIAKLPAGRPAAQSGSHGARPPDCRRSARRSPASPAGRSRAGRCLPWCCEAPLFLRR